MTKAKHASALFRMVEMFERALGRGREMSGLDVRDVWSTKHAFDLPTKPRCIARSLKASRIA
jgi:hypothetical protein